VSGFAENQLIVGPIIARPEHCVFNQKFIDVFSGIQQMTRKQQKRYAVAYPEQFWAILFFEIAAKLPAKLVAIEQKRIIAAAVSFICVSIGRFRGQHSGVNGRAAVALAFGLLAFDGEDLQKPFFRRKGSTAEKS
jgi:hypothetical protein